MFARLTSVCGSSSKGLCQSVVFSVSLDDHFMDYVFCYLFHCFYHLDNADPSQKLSLQNMASQSLWNVFSISSQNIWMASSKAFDCLQKPFFLKVFIFSASRLGSRDIMHSSSCNGKQVTKECSFLKVSGVLRYEVATGLRRLSRAYTFRAPCLGIPRASWFQETRLRARSRCFCAAVINIEAFHNRLS